MSKPILIAHGLKKKINGKQIIKNVDIEIYPGEVYGFLGPNGAGKSTTLRMLVGLSKPSAGSVFIGDYSLKNNFSKAMDLIGCIIEKPEFYEYISGYRNLEMLASMSDKYIKSDIDEFVSFVGLENRIHDRVSEYSMGMKQRLGLAQALLHRPKLLILDEPTNGLDPQGIYTLREIIKKLVIEKEIAVLISSHLISEIQLMCDKVSIINHGEIIKSAKVESILSTSEIFWEISDLRSAKKILKEKFEIDGIIKDNQLIAVIDKENLSLINETFIKENIKIKYVYKNNKTLEELFLDLTIGQQIL
ncbi:ABC transporter ATP-binding protein [Clostridiaceae bacterium HSG29]|nr:ABC transporter ATP-binding protein [Clostridiaceae bacterium HSG29]